MEFKIKTITPFLKEGIHATWENAMGKTMYDFWITAEAEDGSVKDGRISFLTSTARYVAGDVIIANYEKGKFSGHKKKEEQTGQQQPAAGRTYAERQLTPDQSEQILKQVAYECAIAYIKECDINTLSKGYDYKCANKFLEWLKSRTKDNNTGRVASNALRRAVECSMLPPLRAGDERDKGSDRIILKANEIFEYYESK